MKRGRMQCKDLNTLVTLALLAKNPDKWHSYSHDHSRSVLPAFPDGISTKLLLAKMHQLIDQGLITGCACGCAGNFTITTEGCRKLREEETR